MNERVKRLAEEFIKLGPAEQDDLIDQLIVLRKPDPDIDKVWVDEARGRLEAWRRGELASHSAEAALAKYFEP